MPAHRQNFKHGTMSKYRQGCSCDKCRAANKARCDELKEQRLQRPIPRRVHGSLNGYNNYNCRCAKCVVVHREKDERYMPGYREAHREEARERSRLWRKKKKAEMLLKEKKRRARLAQKG